MSCGRNALKNKIAFVIQIENYNGRIFNKKERKEKSMEGMLYQLSAITLI